MRPKLTVASLAILLSGCAASNNAAPVYVAPPLPPRVAAEAMRPATPIPAAKALNNKEAAALLIDLRKSELRYRRNGLAMKKHIEATSKAAPK